MVSEWDSGGGCAQASRTGYLGAFATSWYRDKIIPSGMNKDSHLPAIAPVKRFRRGRHDRGR
jgi:hypothetical protein